MNSSSFSLLDLRNQRLYASRCFDVFLSLTFHIQSISKALLALSSEYTQNPAAYYNLTITTLVQAIVITCLDYCSSLDLVNLLGPL